MKPQTIAIDGPAGSGKSTIGGALGKWLGYAFLDTGLLYRLVAVQVVNSNGDPDSEDDVHKAALTALSRVNVSTGERGFEVLVGKSRIEDMDLHQTAISLAVPRVARFDSVRGLIRDIQQRIIETGPSILAGRDIGTVVAPKAELKLFLDVSLEERAARRLWAGGHRPSASQEELETSLAVRDKMDRERSTSPLSVAADSVVVRTDRMTVRETVFAIVAMCGLEAVGGV